LYLAFPKKEISPEVALSKAEIPQNLVCSVLPSTFEVGNNSRSFSNEILYFIRPLN
jgi:hypothetical protein